MEEFKTLISQEELQKRLQELANQLDKDYKGEEIIAICVMRGSIFFAVDLTLKMKTKMKFEFLTISSYEGTESTGKIEFIQDLRESIKGKNVLILEDIIDTGRSMNFLLEYLRIKECANAYLNEINIDNSVLIECGKAVCEITLCDKESINLNNINK